MMLQYALDASIGPHRASPGRQQSQDAGEPTTLAFPVSHWPAPGASQAMNYTNCWSLKKKVRGVMALRARRETLACACMYGYPYLAHYLILACFEYVCLK